MQVKKSITAITVTSLAALLFFSSCSQLPEQTKYIPKEAVMVAGINGKSLVKKGAWNELTGNSVLQRLRSSANPQQQEFLDHPAETGVNTLSTFYLFFKPDKRFGDGYVGIIASLNNADKFSAFMQKSLDTVPVKKEGDISSMLIGKKGLLGWDKKAAIFLIPSAGNAVNGNVIKQLITDKDSLFIHLHNDSTAFSRLLKAPDSSFDIQALYTEMHHLFALPESSSISSNDKFISLQREDADMSFWMNLEELYKTTPSGSPFLKADYFNNSYLAMAVNFNDGAIDVDGKSYSNEQLMAIVRKYSGKTIDMHYIKDLPSANIVGLMAAAFKPDFISALLNYYGLDGMVNLALSTQGLSLDTLLNAFSGDMVLAASDLKIAGTPSDSVASPGTSVSWLFSMGLNNGHTFDQLLHLADSNELIRKQGDEYLLRMPGSTVTLLKTAKLFTVASDQATADKFGSGRKNTAIDPVMLGKIEGQPFAFYLNIHRIMQAIPDNFPDEERNRDMETMKGLFQDFYITGGQVTKDATLFKVKLNFINRQDNSLIQLMRTGTKLYEQRDTTMAAL